MKKLQAVRKHAAGVSYIAGRKLTCIKPLRKLDRNRKLKLLVAYLTHWLLISGYTLQPY
jgi:hypothetical protein